MKYLSGKHKQAKAISAVIKQHLKPDQVFVEPFMGSCNITSALPGVLRIASDIDGDLVRMYQELVYHDWEPPEVITQEQYYDIKFNRDNYHPALYAFVAYGCSFAGKKWGGFARQKSGDGALARGYAKEAHNSLLYKKKPYLKGVFFFNLSYDKLVIPDNSLIYCDPPYAGTTSYTHGKFDHTIFWQWCDKQVEQGHTVLVSEYAAPDHWIPVWEKPYASQLSHDRIQKPKQAIEKLFIRKNI